ncbi:MAG: hypothetical protein JW941_00965 [Candidatus Coatesbacteria bacterium]|nr:hypothetical protein [Candidatus Coatesbacteria bacterium]
MKRHVLIIICCLMATSLLATSVAHANWYATQRNKEGLLFLSEGNMDDAIKSFRLAIQSYEGYEKNKFSLERAPLYFNLAQACLAKMDTFPLLSRGYEYYWRMGLLTAKKAMDIQYKHPRVVEYFRARPTDLFDLTLDSGCEEVRGFLKMRNLVDKLENTRRMAMFEKCVNHGPSPASNIMTIGPTEFSPSGVKTTERPAASASQSSPQPRKAPQRSNSTKGQVGSGAKVTYGNR